MPDLTIIFLKWLNLFGRAPYTPLSTHHTETTMTHFLKPLSASALALLLAACGSSDAPTPVIAPQAVVTMTTTQQSRGNVVVPSDYHALVQRLYVAYFGRPADPGGLAFFAGNYMNAGAATTVFELSNSYGVNAQVRTLMDNFGNSKESQDLYGGDNVNFVSAIYRNLFNREPEQAGLDFWVGHVNAGRLTRAQAAVAIMAGAQGTDSTLIDLKTRMAAEFTTALNTTTKQSAYSGLTANAVVRTMLSNVTLSTDVTTFPLLIDGVINNVVAMLPQDLFMPAFNIIVQRCAGCHSAKPTIAGFSPAPRGIKYDTTSEVKAGAARIAATVASGSMPWGNMTGMTEEERAVIANWYKSVTP